MKKENSRKVKHLRYKKWTGDQSKKVFQNKINIQINKVGKNKLNKNSEKTEDFN